MTDESPQGAKESTASDRLKDIGKTLARHNLFQGLSPEKLRSILEDLGPTFIKLGQIMSMRPDVLPEEYCRELTKLRSDVKQMRFEDVLGVLEAEYGTMWDQVFASIERKPLGSASIAQVHEAWTKDGRKIVIKVQRPGVYEKMAQDVALMHRALHVAKTVSGTGKVIDLNTVVDEVWTVARQELDFTVEAQNNEDFRTLNAGIKYIAFPQIDWSLTTSKVLAMEYIDGIPIDDTKALGNEGYDLTEVCEKLVGNYIKQVIDDGFFHADPHPGNIRISNGKIVWLDLGMAGRLSNRDRRLLKSAVEALATNDIFSLKDIVLAIGEHDSPIDHDRLYSDIDEMVRKYGSIEIGNINVGRFSKDLVQTADKNGISMPSGVSILGRGILTIEGVLTKINPEVNPLEIMANQVSGYFFHDLDPIAELRNNSRKVYGVAKRAAELPIQISDILKTTARGQAKLNIRFTDTEQAISGLGAHVNGLIIALMNAAIIIGSSLVYLSDTHPQILGIPLPSALGYAISIVLSAGLVFRALNNRAKRRL